MSLQPPSPRPTTELTELQLDELIRRHASDQSEQVHDDLEAELELIAALPVIFPDATPTSLPSMSSPRLAHTLRRAAQPDAEPAPLAPKIESASTRAPTKPAMAAPLLAALAALPDASITEVRRVTRTVHPGSSSTPTELPVMFATATPGAPEPAPATAPSSITPVQASTASAAAPSESPLAAGAPRWSRSLSSGRAHLGFMVLLVIILGTAALLFQ